jgi:hypothetical protein
MGKTVVALVTRLKEERDRALTALEVNMQIGSIDTGEGSSTTVSVEGELITVTLQQGFLRVSHILTKQAALELSVLFAKAADSI